jgi:ABC-2 type transport system ATP-binding protein
LEHVLVIDRGRIVVAAAADDLRGRAVTVSGATAAVEAFAAARKVWHRTGIGSLASATVAGPLDDLARARARDLGLEVAPVSLQELVIRSARFGTGIGTEQQPERISA